MQTSVKFKAAAGVLAVLTAAGIAAWIYQLVGGLGVTGMNNGTSWGLYITCFMFFVGLSAGGLIVASSASVFHVKEYKKVALPAVILSTVCICLAGMFVLIDLGSIQRVWQIIVSPNPTSPLFWDICVITLYLAINVVYLVFMMSKKPGAENRVAIVSRFALPVAILVHSVTAWIFGLELAREGWYSAIMAPLFVVSAMDSGLALLLLSLMGLNKSGLFKTDKKLLSNLAGLLAVCIAIDGFLIGCEVLTMAYPGAAGAETLAIMATGATAPFFWFEIIVGILIPFAILVFAKNRARMGLVAAASVCVVVGVFCKRLWLLLTSFAEFNVAGAPGIIGGSSSAAHAAGSEAWALASAYAPTWVEIVVAVGVVSLGVLAFMILCKRLLPGNRTASDAETSECGPVGEAV
ncbi:NrfD/PsrC family molybdoenzyme membrane anchor subunit [Raoultibacter phocaeensis]|uniref:NrfD/PsrC family molybdoenzyme membrane anchor subunit n=1 Tax=Raoultibacter phocaeensis TaxID=2479841 RepID=UPI00111B365D|nr:NrfD/PsrC family molybdoenzyme membrane anchor subunit [Raoultibacter phocaeensis]